MFLVLFVGLVYIVIEVDYIIVEGYMINLGMRELIGIIVNKGDYKVDFVNEWIVNKLIVSNIVMGNGGDKMKDFEYIVIFEGMGKDGSYFYVKLDGSIGMIKFMDIFEFKYGEILDIFDLFKGLKYIVI